MRKHTAAFLMVLVLCTQLFSCSSIDNGHEASYLDSEPSQSDMQEWMHTECSKDYVREFLSVLETDESEGLQSGYHFDEEHCYNVTPGSVSMYTDIKIFKFSDSCISLALIGGEVHEICTSFGGYGFFNKP